MDRVIAKKYFDEKGLQPTSIINLYSIGELEAIYQKLEEDATVQTPRLNGVSLYRLRSFDGSGDIPAGGYWANLSSCLVTSLTIPKSGHPRKGVRDIPEVLKKWSVEWKQGNAQARLGVHHIAWRLSTQKELPVLGQGQDEGNEYVVEHLCDTQGCFNKRHMGPVSTPGTNTKRSAAGCVGTILVVKEGVIIKKQTFCVHAQKCIKVSVVELDDE
jgi:hypothetical protein